MKKYLLVIACYNDARQDFFRQYTSPRNKEYCQQHNYEYLELTSNLIAFRGNLTWNKISTVRNLLNENVLKDNDILVHLDADMCLVKPELEYPCNKSFSYVIDSGNTHCMGNYSIKINDWSRQLLENILSEERYQKFKNVLTIHEYFGTLSPFWEEFREQASWYSLAGIKRHSNKPFWEYSDYGWHSTPFPEDTVYSLEELYENVEVLPTEWNVTELEGESSCIFNINKVKKENVIIRHFAGGQPWRKEWFQKTN